MGYVCLATIPSYFCMAIPDLRLSFTCIYPNRRSFYLSVFCVDFVVKKLEMKHNFFSEYFNLHLQVIIPPKIRVNSRTDAQCDYLTLLYQRAQSLQNYQRDALNIIYSSNIITLLYMFRVSSTHLQEDIVVHKQHMVSSLSIRVLVAC